MLNAARSLDHIHRFVPSTVDGKPPLLLLHGTGGDENDLLSLGSALSPGSALLSPRGQVVENGMPRFFRRLSEGIFDEADVERRARDLSRFVGQAREAYGFDPPLAVGFSNGANIAAALLMLEPEALAGAVLIRPMMPFAVPPTFRLPRTPILMLSGAMDPIVPAFNAQDLAKTLEEAGARLRHEVLPVGHGLGQMDLTIAKAWIAGFGD